tara:strand:- start:8655 stop:8801 length:147 start_codon:yes stop_codon:yes gene_type:complete
VQQPWIDSFLAALTGPNNGGGSGGAGGPMVQDPPGSGLYIPDTSQIEE